MDLQIVVVTFLIAGLSLCVLILFLLSGDRRRLRVRCPTLGEQGVVEIAERPGSGRSHWVILRCSLWHGKRCAGECLRHYRASQSGTHAQAA
jgi:hypothetical protein